MATDGEEVSDGDVLSLTDTLSWQCSIASPFLLLWPVVPAGMAFASPTCGLDGGRAASPMVVQEGLHFGAFYAEVSIEPDDARTLCSKDVAKITSGAYTGEEASGVSRDYILSKFTFSLTIQVYQFIDQLLSLLVRRAGINFCTCEYFLRRACSLWSCHDVLGRGVKKVHHT